MKKEYLNWNIFDLEKEVGKTSFLNLLEYILENNNPLAVMEAIKASGYFVSYSEVRDSKISDDFIQKDKVRKFVEEKLGEKYIKKFHELEREAQFLRDKRNDISRYIDNILETYQIDYEILIATAVTYLRNIDNNFEKIEYIQKYLGTKEYVIFVLGDLIKAVTYSRRDNEKEKDRITFEKLQDLWQYALTLREFNEIIQSWMFGELEIIVDEEGISTIELPGKNTERLVSALNFWDIKDIKQIAKEIEALDNEEDNIITYQKILKSKLQEYFYTDDFHEEYLDLPLRDWIKIYTYFKRMALENAEEDFIKIDVEKLEAKLISNGFSTKQIEIIMNNFVFSIRARDLFDTFLIRHKKDIYFVPEVYNLIDASRAMLSLFGGQNDKKTRIEDKGKAFEDHIRTLLSGDGNGIKIQKNIFANEREENYEIDIVFELDNIIFFCECKTQSQHQDMRGYFRNMRELEIYLEKFKRNYTFFTQTEKGIQIIKEKMKVNEIKESVPIFISNIVYPNVKIDGIFITDEPRIYRYMKRMSANLYDCNFRQKIIKVYKLFDEFYQGEINARQFIGYLKNKKKEMDLEYKRIKLIDNNSLNQMGIHSERYIEDKNRNYLFS